MCIRDRYALIRMSGGKPLSYRRAVSAEENDFLAGAIMDVLVKSAAWPGNDLSNLDEYYIVRQEFPEVPETHDYYAYLLDVYKRQCPSFTAQTTRAWS